MSDTIHDMPKEFFIVFLCLAAFAMTAGYHTNNFLVLVSWGFYLCAMFSWYKWMADIFFEIPTGGQVLFWLFTGFGWAYGIYVYGGVTGVWGWLSG